MPETEEEMAALMEAWQNWFAELGESLVDSGSPFGARQIVAADGAVSEGGPSNGFGVIAADSFADAVLKTKNCPVLSLGSDNAVEISECLEM